MATLSPVFLEVGVAHWDLRLAKVCRVQSNACFVGELLPHDERLRVAQYFEELKVGRARNLSQNSTETGSRFVDVVGASGPVVVVALRSRDTDHLWCLQSGVVDPDDDTCPVVVS